MRDTPPSCGPTSAARGLFAAIAIALVAPSASGTTLLWAGGAFLNDPGQPYPAEPRLRFDSRLMFRNTINGGAIAIGDEWVLHSYHALFPFNNAAGVDGYVGHVMDQFDSDGTYLGSFRVIASRENESVDYAVFRVARIQGSATVPAALPAWVDPREPYPPQPGVALWGSFGPQAVTVGPGGEPIQTPPHPRGIKWGTTSADGQALPGLPSDVQGVSGDSGSGIFVRDGFNLRLARVDGAALTSAVREQVEQWVTQMGGTLRRPALEVGTYATARMGGGGDWAQPAGWTGGLPGPGDTAWIDDDATVNVTVAGAAAGNLYVGTGQHGLSGHGTLAIGPAPAATLQAGSILLGVTEGAGAGPSRGAIAQSGGVVSAGVVVAGYRGHGSYTLTGGTLAAAGEVVLGRDVGSAGTLSVGPAGRVIASTMVVGREGAGAVDQSGGVVAVTGDLRLGHADHGVGRYAIGGGALAVGSNLVVGAYAGSTGTLAIGPGGAVTATRATISRGGLSMTGGGAATFAYATSGGAARLDLGGGSLRLNEGGVLAGTLDFANGATRLTLGGLADLSGARIFNAANASLAALDGALILLPAGVSTASFGSVAAADAVVHTAGGTLSVAADKHLRVYGTIADFVRVEGSLSATAGVGGAGIVLLRGFEVATGGTLAMGDAGNAFVSADSLNAGGLVSGGSVRVSGGRTFAQSGGTSAFASQVKLRDAGTIALAGGVFAADSIELLGRLAQSGGALRVTGATVLGGRFDQTGGTADLSRIEPTDPPVPAAAVTVSGGTLAVGEIRAPRLEITGAGVVMLDPASASPAVSIVNALSVAPVAAGATPRLDLNREPLVVDYAADSPLAAITAAVRAGRAGGAWTGGGITSAAAAGDPTRYAVGVAEAADLGLTRFAGHDLADPTAVLLRFTRAGDANLDAVVSMADFALLAADFGAPGGWARGDFDYDGDIGIADFSILAANFNSGLDDATAIAANLHASLASPGARGIPEPASPLLAGPGMLVALSRRRRRRRRPFGRRVD